MPREQHMGWHYSLSTTATQGDVARVFVVDDNDLTRWTLRNIIGRDKRLVLIGDALDGAAALEGINVTQPDLVCLDLVMPRLDGLAVLRAIRETCPPTAVVIITAEATAEVLTQARELNVDGLVVKPFSPATVLDAIHKALERCRSGNRVTAAPAPSGDNLGRAR